jgi:hypothetical protein
MTTTTLDPRETSARTTPPARLRHILDELRSTELTAASLCGRQATRLERGGTAHAMDAEPDCVVCRDLDGSAHRRRA